MRRLRSAIFRSASLAPLVLAACAAPRASTNTAAAAVQAAPNVPLATQPTAGQEVGAVADNRILVTFDQGATTLSADADNKLDLAARLFRDARPVAMFVAGYADRSGDEFNNVVISAKRAQAVKKGLVARGIPAEVLLIQAFGASELADASNPDAVANRRAVITWRLL